MCGHVLAQPGCYRCCLAQWLIHNNTYADICRKAQRSGIVALGGNPDQRGWSPNGNSTVCVAVIGCFLVVVMVRPYHSSVPERTVAVTKEAQITETMYN